MYEDHADEWCYMQDVPFASKQHGNLKRIQRKINTILNWPHFCGICMENTNDLCSVLAEFEFFSNEKTVCKSLKEIVNSVFYDVSLIPASPNICKQCTEKAIKTYYFINNTKESARTINNYLNNFNLQLLEIDDHFDTTSKNADNLVIILKSEDFDNNFTDGTETERLNVKIIKPDDDTAENMLTNVHGGKADLSDFKDSPNQHKHTKNAKVDGHKHFKTNKPQTKLQPLKTKNNAYKCVQCDVVLITFKLWKEHERMYHAQPVKPIVCNICAKTFNSNKLLHAHYKTHSKVKCKICHVLITDTDLNEHLRNYHEDEVYHCQSCHIVCYTEQALKLHEIVHGINNPTPVIENNLCIMCLKNFDDEKLKNHKCAYNCPECVEIPCIHHKYLISFRDQILNNRKKAKCLDCDYICCRRKYLIAHVNREHLNHHPHTCDFCGTQFYSKEALCLHITKYHKENYFCQYCEKNIKSKSELDNHENICILEEREFTCKECAASFDTAEELTNHLTLRHSGKVYSCDLCIRQFKAESKLKEHKVKAHRRVQLVRRYSQYVIYNEGFNMKGQLIQRMKTHSNNVKCRICQVEFDSMKKLLSHHNLTHNRHTERREKSTARNMGEGPIYTCEKCGKAFAYEFKLKAHLLTHLPPEPCKDCQKLIKPSAMYGHLREHRMKREGKGRTPDSNRSRKYKCDSCDYAAFTFPMLESHINKYHLKVKPYTCDVCGVAYSGKYQLNEHMYSHKEKRYTCRICNKSILRGVGLKKHMMRFHTGERPYICEVCGEGFITISLLKDHMLKHEGKTVECPLCKDTYYSLRHMKQHFKKVHWKYKNKMFNPKQVKGLNKEHYHLFVDGRMAVLDNSE